MWKLLYNQTGMLSRFIVRRDRVRITIWLFSILLLTVVTANAFLGLYPSAIERQAIAETMKNPAMIAMVGQGYGLENYTIGAMMAHQMLLFTAIAVAIMSILLVTRHTRADEEDGRIELVRSLPVGRLSNLSATVIVLVIINILLAVIVGFGLFALGIDSMDLHGSILYGAALGATGIFFTAVTTFFAQVSESTRGTVGYSFSVLMIAYFIRAIGDVSNEALSWISPLGWILGTQAFVNNYWWPLLLTVGVGLLLIVLALYLNSKRDLGAGLLPSRPGSRNASTFLQSSVGLPIRLQQTSILAWAVGMFILGVSYGSVMGDLEAFFESNEMLMEMLAGIDGLSLTEQYLTMLMSVIAMICTIPPLMFILKIKAEEKKGHMEHVLARAMSRTKVMGSYLAVSIIFGSLMLFLAAVGLWSAAAGVMDEALSFTLIMKSALVYLPAIWIMIGVAVLIIGINPKFTWVSWIYLSYSFLVVYLGGLLQFPEWLGKLSPYGHIPQLPVEELSILKIILLTSIAFVLIVIGFIRFNKRDITG